jgi:phosphotransferase system HPr-like phosphotransfer protein
MDMIIIKLNTADDVNKFVNLVSSYDAPIEVSEVGGFKVVNANSILYLFALDFNKKLCVRIHTQDAKFAKEFYDKLERFKVKNED